MKRTNRVRLTESQLHKVIKESVNRVLKEGHYDSTINNRFFEFADEFGYKEMLEAFYRWVPADVIKSFLQNFERLLKDAEDDY